MPLQPGDLVDDFTFLEPDGAPLALRSFQGQPLIVIFLRHLA
ncbi:MAG: hypothetical protein U0793_20335 [Gemmataceae bacterium]